MLLSILSQTKLILFSLLAGVITGIMFDIYRIIRGSEKIPKIIIFIEDILFWIFAGIIVFIFLLITNHANFSTYAYPCIAIGIFVYLKTLSRLLLRIYFKAGKDISKVIRIIIKRIVYPFKLFSYAVKTKK